MLPFEEIIQYIKCAMSNVITEERVMAALATVEDPELHQDIVSLGFVENVKIQGNDVSFTVNLTTPACPLKDVIGQDCETALRRDIPEISGVNLTFGSRVRQSSDLAEKGDMPFKTVLAVGAGKGGVGKSTVAVNLAVALAASGASVGLLDADIYGPNIPALLSVNEAPQSNGQKIVPVKKFGIEMMSMGFLVPPDQALIWRGPMINSALNQLIFEVGWSNLDYFIVDLPPGTGDAQMSMAQLLPLTGAVVVTTPQEVSVSDTRRGIDAFRKLEVPVLGVIENMSGSVFGTGGGENAALEMQVPFLGRIPLDASVAAAGQNGLPLVLQEDNNSDVYKAFEELVGKIAAAVSVQTA